MSPNSSWWTLRAGAHEGGNAAQESPSIVTCTFFNTVHLFPKEHRFEHGGTKLVSCRGRHLPRYIPASVHWEVAAFARTCPWYDWICGFKTKVKLCCAANAVPEFEQPLQVESARTVWRAVQTARETRDHWHVRNDVTMAWSRSKSNQGYVTVRCNRSRTLCEGNVAELCKKWSKCTSGVSLSK